MTATATAEAPTRKHLASPVVLMDTKFGQVEVTFNSGSTVYVHTSYGHAGKCPIIEIRGVQYTIGVHVTRGDDNYMRISGDTPHENYQYTSVHRTDWGKEPSSAARKTVAEMAIEVAARAVLNNTDIFRLAELANINNDLMTLDRKIAEAQAALDAMNEDAAQKRAREALLTLAGE